MNQQVHRGRDVFAAAIGALLDAGGCGDRVLLVAGNRGYTASGAASLLEVPLGGREVLKINQLSENPDAETLARLLPLVANFEPSVMIAVGGGSVIDYAKLIKAFFRECASFDPKSIPTVPPSPADVPFFAIPTTAGSGSEATHFAVVYSGGLKYSVGSAHLLPDACFLVPELLAAAPPSQRAASALDALCQSVESYWSIHSTEASREDAIAALTHCNRALTDIDGFLENRYPVELQEAAYLAGRAINTTKTTAPHSVSYALTTHFGVPHGFAVALLLPGFLLFNDGLSDADMLDGRGARFVRGALLDIASALGCEDCGEAATHLRSLVQGIGGPTTLSEVGVTSPSDIEKILADGFNPQRVNNNPRRVTRSDLANILEAIR